MNTGFIEVFFEKTMKMARLARLLLLLPIFRIGMTVKRISTIILERLVV